MFGKVTKQQVNHHFNRAKDFLGKAYQNVQEHLWRRGAGARLLRIERR
jgi:uncharacterized membrane-anchored protein YhcB (DUF1043 family)